MKKTFLSLCICIVFLNINAAQEKSHINRTTVGLESNTTHEKYIERLHKTGLFLILQHKIFMATYTVYTTSLEEFQKNPAFQRALAKLQTLADKEEIVKHHFKILTICSLLDAAPLPAQEPMGKLESYDLVRQARNKAAVSLIILKSSALVDDKVMLERLSSIEKNIKGELDKYFEVKNLLILDTIYTEIIRTLRTEILHTKKTKKTRAQYQALMSSLPETLLPQTTRQELLIKEEEYAGMDLKSLSQASIRVGIDLLQPQPQETTTHALPPCATCATEQVIPVHPRPIRMDSVAPTYSLESSYIVQHEHLVRICDPENAMALDLDLSQEGRMLHTYPETPLCDSYSPAVSLGFMTTFNRKLLQKDPFAIQKYRFSPLVDQFITKLGNEYFVLHNPKTKRECIFIPETMNDTQRWLAHAQRHDLRPVTRIEIDGHAYLYTMKARIPCTFSYEFNPESNAVVSRTMTLYP